MQKRRGGAVYAVDKRRGLCYNVFNGRAPLEGHRQRKGKTMTELQKKEFETIRGRVKEDLYSPPIAVFKDDPHKTCTIAEYEARTASYDDGTYYFTDLNYAPENRTEWGATVSAYRLLNLLKLGEAEGERERARALVFGHLRGFAARRYTNLNWWHLCIGLPQTVSRLLLALEGELEPALYDYLLSLAERGSIGKDPSVLVNHEGANLIWFCDTSIIHALLTGDAEELALAVKTVSKETEGRPDAGLQEDGSFFQHGRLLYSLGYGRSYVITLAPLFYYLGGTSFAFSERALHNVFSHVLDGVRHMTHGRGLDYLTMGREYVRPGATDPDSVRGALSYFARMTGVSREEEIRAFYQSLCEGGTALVANKYFPVSRYLSHQDEYIHVGFKVLDETLLGTEICNSENVLGVHLSYGTNTCVLRSGEEYRSIAPLLRYDCLPGTTCAEESDEEIETRFVPKEGNLSRHKADVLLSAGGNYGDLSVSVYRVRHDGITQAVSCIATPKSALFLSTGNHGGEKPLHTALEQCNLLGKVTVSEDGHCATHNGVCYVSHSSPLVASVEHRLGYLNRNSRLSAAVPCEGDVFSLLIEHSGKEFCYAYEILAEENAHLLSSVLQNTPMEQRVRLADGREVCIRLCDGEILVK